MLGILDPAPALKSTDNEKEVVNTRFLEDTKGLQNFRISYISVVNILFYYEFPHFPIIFHKEICWA